MFSIIYFERKLTRSKFFLKNRKFQLEYVTPKYIQTEWWKMYDPELQGLNFKRKQSSHLCRKAKKKRWIVSFLTRETVPRQERAFYYHEFIWEKPNLIRKNKILILKPQNVHRLEMQRLHPLFFCWKITSDNMTVYSPPAGLIGFTITDENVLFI